jgi:hypothetical protein
MPNEEDTLNPAERELEAALSALSPAGPTLAFAQIHAESLVIRERRRTRFWRAAAAVLALAAGASFLARPAPRVVEVERVVQRDGDSNAEPRWARVETSPLSQPPPVREDYALLRLREQVLARGVESLRASGGSQRVGAIDSAVLPGRAPVEIPTFAEYLFAGDRS